MNSQDIYKEVTERYSAASRGTTLGYGEAVAKAFGYSDDELKDIPKESNLGLSCGNPLAMASIREGETVVDLGSGAGFDVFLAANKVGLSGKVIGVDMNQDMLARANEIKSKHGKTNVTFIESQITKMLAIESNSVDCIISNCVVNLVPEADKHLVFDEMHRVLKPGGRVAISDILAKKPLPEKLRANMALYVGCVSGASLVEQYKQYLKEAGFPADSLLIKDDGADLNVYIETNSDGSRTVGGTGGNLCCNPRLESTPAPSATSCSASVRKACSGSNSDPRSSAGSNPLCCAGQKVDADTATVAAAAAAAAAAASDPSCCAGESAKDQVCAFDEKDLADLEGEDLNSWAGSYKIYAVKAL